MFCLLYVLKESQKDLNRIQKGLFFEESNMLFFLNIGFFFLLIFFISWLAKEKN